VNNNLKGFQDIRFRRFKSFFGGEHMKKLLAPIVMVLIVAVGCLPTIPTYNQPPTAYIDVVSPSNANLGETVSFTGHGVDPDGNIGAYNWRSSLDGDLSTEPSFKTSSLSQGTHTIWFKVQDDGGDWSKEILTTVIVVPVGGGQLVVKSFGASPGKIVKGEASTLSWNVSGDATVSISPDIGDVALMGNRQVLPTKTTTYTLTATSAVGTVTATTQVVVEAIAFNKVELYSLAAEDGYVRGDGVVGQQVMVGYTAQKIGIQGFMSFDISAIPKGAVIKSASLDLDPGAVDVVGSPSSMGNLYICNHVYGGLDRNDYVVGPPAGVICSLGAWPSSCISSTLTVASVQAQVDSGSARLQVRLQFEKAPTTTSYSARWSEQLSSQEDNILDFVNANPKLIIEYQ
jgi:hypothetical protein